MVGDADFPNVVHGAGMVNEVAFVIVQSHAACQALTQFADAYNVHAGFIIAVFRRPSQSVNDFNLILPQFLGAFHHFGLELFFIIVERVVQHPDFQQIVDARQYFLHDEGFVDKVLGARLDRFQPGFGIQLRREHQNRKVALRFQSFEGIHDIEPAECRHSDIQKNQVRMYGLIDVRSRATVGGGGDVVVTGGV